MITPDLSQIVNQDPPVGTHLGEIVEVRDTTSSNNNPMLIVTTVFEDDGIKYEAVGFHVYKGRGTFGFMNLLEATGFGEEAKRFQKGEQVPFDEQRLIGQKVQVVVSERVVNGQPRKSVDRYLPA
jgi:hypothetical protein